MPDWLSQLLAELLVVGLWCVWWLWAVDWRKVWPILARGAWTPAVLLMVGSAYAWSRIAPGECGCLGFVTIPNFWWQFGDVCGLAALALICGWLQGYLGWAPHEYAIKP